ncbi:MAG: hypothetical protein AAGB00_07965 [Planctomycetota bacterium]
MPLPSIKTSLPILVVAWLVGAWLAGMGPLLLYPAMWLGVAGLLYAANLASGDAKPPGAEPIDGPTADPVGADN